MAEVEQRAPRQFDTAVCAGCRSTIPHGAPKVSQGTGWLCQACAYQHALSRQRMKGTGSR